MRDALPLILEEVDEDDLTHLLVYPGARLAIDVLDDGMANASPIYQARFISNVIRVLEQTPDGEVERLARVLSPLLSDSTARKASFNPIDRQVADPVAPSLSALLLLSVWTESEGPLATGADERLRRVVGLLPPASQLVVATLANEHSRGLLPRLVGHARRKDIGPTGKAAARQVVERQRAEGVVIGEVARRPSDVLSELSRPVVTRERIANEIRAVNSATIEAGRHARDAAAAAAQSLPFDAWRVSAHIRRLLSRSVERDEVGLLLD